MRLLLLFDVCGSRAVNPTASTVNNDNIDNGNNSKYIRSSRQNQSQRERERELSNGDSETQRNVVNHFYFSFFHSV